MQPDNVGDLIEELGAEVVMTPAVFHRERARLEKQFLIPYGVHTAAEIDRMIRSGEIQESELVQDWIELHALEPYVFPKARQRPPDKNKGRRDDSGQEGRDSGLFAFRQGMIGAYARVQRVAELATGWASPRVKLAGIFALVEGLQARCFAATPRFLRNRLSVRSEMASASGHAARIRRP